MSKSNNFKVGDIVLISSAPDDPGVPGVITTRKFLQVHEAKPFLYVEDFTENYVLILIPNIYNTGIKREHFASHNTVFTGDFIVIPVDEKHVYRTPTPLGEFIYKKFFSD